MIPLGSPLLPHLSPPHPHRRRPRRPPSHQHPSHQNPPHQHRGHLLRLRYIARAIALATLLAVRGVSLPLAPTAHADPTTHAAIAHATPIDWDSPPGATAVVAQPVHWQWPVDPPRNILRGFSAGPHPWSPGHRGVDLALPVGNLNVYAAGEGKVVFAGKVVDRMVVSILHRDGIRTTYQPVDPVVQVEDVVDAGQLIGMVNQLHPPCTSPCVHWGAKRARNSYLNPILLVVSDVVLLPPDPPASRQAPDGHLRTRVGLVKDRFESIGVNMGVTLGGGKGGMPQNLLYAAQIRAPGQQMGRSRVAQYVRRNLW